MREYAAYVALCLDRTERMALEWEGVKYFSRDHLTVLARHMVGESEHFNRDGALRPNRKVMLKLETSREQRKVRNYSSSLEL